MQRSISFFISLGVAALCVGCGPRCPKEADLLIVGGTVYDGSEAAPTLADIAVAGDRIVYVAPAKKDIAARRAAKKTIDAQGYVVCPGFIDPHDHVEKYLIDTRANEAYLRMGVTTVISGMCGGSRYPISEYFRILESQGIGTNAASFSGHNTLRRVVMGDEARAATPQEVERMQEMLRQEMRDGSFGLSTGLYYVPGCFSDYSEVVALARTAGEGGGIYTTHVRNENKYNLGLVASIREALEIGREAGLPVNISHIKCLGRGVWHKADSVVALIESYQRQGMKVTADQYPYLASGLDMASALVPAWALDGGIDALRSRIRDAGTRARLLAELPEMIHERGGAETIYIASKAGDYSAMTLSQAAEKMGKSPEETVLELLKTSLPYLNTFVINEDDLTTFMKQPWVMSCTDGSFGTHPRAAGSYAELIQTYVQEKQVLTLGRFIRRSTGQVADTYALDGRGYIREGCYADITVFKPEEVRAHASYAEPTRFSTGFRAVVVNGELAIENDNYTGALSGAVIRHKSVE